MPDRFLDLAFFCSRNLCEFTSRQLLPDSVAYFATGNNVLFGGHDVDLIRKL